MANNAVSPSRIINYISQRKKLIVGRNNQPNQQLIKFDYKLTDTYNFQVINQINQIVAIPSGTTFELYGSFIDGKQQQHLLFYTSGVTADEDDVLTFVVDSYTSEYLNQVKVQKEIDLSIVATDEQGNKSMTLRDKAIAYPRPYVEGRVPTQIVQEIVYVYNQPVTGSFSAGSDINLAPDVDSYAFGEGLYTDTQNQLVIGSWNVPSSTTNQAFVIGNGDNDSNRSNAFSVDWDGNVQAGAISATEIYINGLPVGADTDAKIEVLSTAIDDLSASVPTKVSDLENDAGYLTSSDIPSDYVTNTQLDEAISSFITIEDVPVYTADNKTLQLNGTEFSIKSLESKISGGVGINVTTTDDVTWITYIGGSSTGGKTYLNGTGLGLSTVSAEDGIYKLYVNQSWLEGKIEAQTSGSFDDISISIDNVSGIVDSNYETLTDQTNYLSGQIDASNEAIGAVSDRVQIIENDYTTSGTVTGWINDLATGAVKTNSDSIEYLSGQISANTASINELTNAVGSKADLSDFQELTGVVDGINTNLTSNYYTKTEIDTATGAIDERLTGLEENTAGYQNAEQVSGIVTSYNYITSSDIPTQVSVFENDALYVTSSQLTGELNDYTKTTDLNDYLSTGILTGYVTDQQLEEAGFATTSALDAASSAILSTLTSDYALKTDIPTNDEITGLASAYVDTLNIDTTYATKSEIDDFATSAEVSSIIDLKVTSGYVHDLGFITNSEVEPGTVYSTGFGLAASGDAFNTFYLTGTVLSGSEHISIENNVVSLIGEVGKTYSGTANGGVEVDNTNNTITISSNFLSSNALDSYGDKTWVKTNFLSTSYSTTIEGNSQAIEDIQGVTGTFALKADIPADINDFATSAEVSGIVEGLSTAIRTGLASVSAIPTAVSELTNDVPYLSTITSADIPTSYVQQSDLAEYAQLSDIPTNSQITGLAKDYVDTLNLATTYAQLSDIPTGLASWESNTNKDYISGLGFITSDDVEPGTVYKTSFGLAASGAANNIFYLTAGVADLNGYDTLALKSDLPTNDEITGLAKDYVDSLDLAGTYASATEFNSVCAALSDAITGLNDTLGTKANSDDVYTKTEANEAFLSSNTFIPVSASQLSGYDDLALKTDLADYITGITFIDGDNNQFASNIFYVSDDLVLTVDEEDENKITLGINGSLAHLEDIPTEATITGYAYNVTTGTVTSSYLTGLGMATTGQIPTKTSDLTNDSEFATTGYVTGYCSSFITIEDVPTKVSQLQNDVAYLPSSGLSSVYGLLNGVNINITQAGDGTITLSAGTGGGGGTTYTAGSGISITNNTIAVTGMVTTDQISNYATIDLLSSTSATIMSTFPPYTAGNGIYINDSDVISLNIAAGPGINLWWSGTAHVEAKLSSTGSVSLSTLEDNTILISGGSSGKTYTGGTGIEVDNTNDTISLTATIPTAVSQLTNDSGYITGITSSNITTALGFTPVSSDTTYTAGTGLKLEGTEFSLTASIPSVEGLISASEAETIANDAITSNVTSSYLTGLGMATTGQIPTKTSDLTNDSGYITLGDVPAAPSTVYDKLSAGSNITLSKDDSTGITTIAATGGGGGGGTTYTAGDGIDISNDEISVKLSGGNNVTLSTDSTGLITINATGGGSAGNIVGGAGIRVMQDGGNTIISIATATLAMAPSSYTFDFRNTSGTVAFDYTSYTGNQNLIRTISGSLPNGITASGITSGYQFDYVSAANCSNGTTVVTAWFDAYDITQPASAQVTFTTIGFVSASVSAATNTEFTFDVGDGNVTSTFVFNYVDGGADLDIQIGDLPAGISATVVNNTVVFTADSADFEKNMDRYVSISFNAIDIEPVTYNVLIHITGVQFVDYTTEPLTFEAVDGGATLAFENGGSAPTVAVRYQKGIADWADYTMGTQLQLSAGQKVAFSGNNSTYASDWYGPSVSNHFTSTSGKLKVYGNLRSLINFGTSGGNNTFANLFSNNTHIINVQNLIFDCIPSTYCYAEMFNECTALTAGPKLITCKNSYDGSGYPDFYMYTFWKTALTSIPLLDPRITGNYVWCNMFMNCTSLKEVMLPFTNISWNNHMEKMFSGCTNLSSIDVSFTDWASSNNATNAWVSGVAANGVFYKPATLSTEFGDSRIPNNWTVIDKNWSVDDIPAITFNKSDSGTAVSVDITSAVHYSGTGSVSYKVVGYLPSNVEFADGVFSCVPSSITDNKTVEVFVVFTSTDMGSWSKVVKIKLSNPLGIPLTFTGNAASNAVQLNKNRSSNAITLQYSKNNGAWTTYNWSGDNGDIITLASGDTVAFSGANSLMGNSTVDYYNFAMTGSIIAAGNIQSLLNFSTNAPDYCYVYLFYNCNSLTDASEMILPATTLGDRSYLNMFMNCSNLLTSPTLTDATAGPFSYAQMFRYCSSLSSITVQFTNWSASADATADWVQGVAANGTFTKPTGLAETYGTSNIPSGWTVVNK